MESRPVDAEAIARAVEVLRRGGLVAMPTETVYGLAADAGNEAAVRAIFAAKGRPADHPVIVHIPDAAAMHHWAADVPAAADALAAAFWPGPLTLVLKRAAGGLRSDHRRAGHGGPALPGSSVGAARCCRHSAAESLRRAPTASDGSARHRPGTWSRTSASSRTGWSTWCWTAAAARSVSNRRSSICPARRRACCGPAP